MQFKLAALNTEKEVAPERDQKEVLIPHHPEAVRHSHPTLEALPGQHPGEVYAYYGPDDVIKSQKRSCWKRKRVWVLALVLTVVIASTALCVSLGILLKKPKSATSGSKATPTNLATATVTASASSVPSPTAKPTSIASLSPLAVTAWRDNNSTGTTFKIRVVFQNDKGMLQGTLFDSGYKSWARNKDFTKAKQGTSLALTRFRHNIYPDAINNDEQVELFYLDDADRICEWNWDSINIAGSAGSIDNQTFVASSTSRLSAYWPLIILQDVDGSLHEIYYDAFSYSDTGGWYHRSANLTIYDGAALGLVPVAQNISKIGVFYQGEDGKLREVQRDKLTWEYAYETHALSQSIPPPSLTPPQFAAFSLTNVTNPTELDTYILWQDTSATIQMQWRDDSSGWKGPKTFDAFRGADNGTAIACITMETFNEPLPKGMDIPRCYFQSGGNLREVELNGNRDGWSVLGYVPLD
ncbi:uncharacterized protein BDR25DRAFT_52625 [Lindgomyces ingoldianus]|uniref:Uncharacterized protein n=1 Tax=Lindgomyces ingoldianus TaxID=673940 RepID=A0ACB6QP54_9PLEO|nr:uncharacterized protein BDR25DRAFT_52625 [Lindgomyces ingoldianus]KAF2468753.1 hypothetical protein BDR25DRAFT_52625 [Lindgomyces ingoldianus]